MPQFAVLTEDGVDDKRYDSIDEATDAAKAAVEDPDTEVEIVQILRKVSSTLEITVEDVA